MRLSAIVLCGLALTSAAFAADTGIRPADPLPLPAGVKIMFSPKDDIAGEIIRLINHANAEILFNVHAITNPRIAQALVTAFADRKVYVAGLMDSDPPITNYTTPGYFTLNKLPYAYPRGDGISDIRYIVIDRQIVVTGSYDWTMSSQTKNHDNILEITEPSIALRYVKHFLIELHNSDLPQAAADSQSPSPAATQAQTP